MSDSWDITPFQLTWALVGLLVLVVVAFVLQRSIGGLVLGVFLYYGTRPVCRKLDTYVDNRSVSATVALSTVGLPMVLVIGYALLVGYQEATTLVNSRVAQDVQQVLRPVIDPGTLWNRQRWLDLLRGNLSIFQTYATTLFAWGIRLFIMVTVAYYLLQDGQKAGDWFRDAFDDYNAVQFLEDIDEDLTSIYTGNMLTIALTGVIAAVVFYLFNLLVPGDAAIRYPILLGLLIGAGTLVPVVGMAAIYFPYTAILVVRAVVWDLLPIWVPVAFFATTFVVVDKFPDLYLRSYVSKGGINMGLMILSYVLGAQAFGWYGVFLGPLILVVFLRFARQVFPALVHGWPGQLLTS